MADPLTIIGGVGAICNIIEAASKVISTLNSLRHRWATADMTLLSLAAQLTALRAALSKIQTWMEDSYTQVLHYQLTMDLETSVACCNLLITELGAVVSGLEDCVDRPLDFARRLRVAFSHRKVDDVEKLLQQQTSALNLLLTTWNCTTALEREQSWNKLRSLKGIERPRPKAESVSLFGLRDSDSFRSMQSDSFSKLSMEFDFDAQIFSTNVYHRVFSTHARRAWRQPHQSQPKPCSCQKVPLLGDDRPISEIHETHLRQCTAEDITYCRSSRIINCVDQTRLLVQALSQLTDPSLQDIAVYCQSLLVGCSSDFGSNAAQEQLTLEAITSIWEKAATMPQHIFKAPGFASLISPDYFAQEMKQLRSPDLFPPTAADLLKAHAVHRDHDLLYMGALQDGRLS